LKEKEKFKLELIKHNLLDNFRNEINKLNEYFKREYVEWNGKVTTHHTKYLMLYCYRYEMLTSNNTKNQLKLSFDDENHQNKQQHRFIL
jgi:hypothetical protein